MRRRPIGLVLWLVALAGAETVCFVMLARFFVRTGHGQLLDTIALTGRQIGRARVAGMVDLVLNTISIVSVVIATALVGFIALIRRRAAVAVGVVLLIAGANATTELLKWAIRRPNLGVDLPRAAAGNSLPSGHTTIAASVAVAVLLVLPPRLRGGGALLGALGTAVMGVATLSAGWHRPSDAVAALLVVGVWSCVAGLFILAAQRDHGRVEYGPVNWLALPVLAIAGLALLAGAGIALKLTDHVLATPVDELSRSRLLIAYAGGAMGIAGTASLVLAAVLATVRRVVPQAVTPDARTRSAGVTGADAAS